MSPAAVAYIGREVAKALEAVHTMCDDYGRNCGVVHRDVTPSNILVSRDGRDPSAFVAHVRSAKERTVR